MKRVFLIALGLNLILINPASAIFGFECRNSESAIKKVITDLQREKKLVKSYEAEQISLFRYRTNAELQEGYRACLTSKNEIRIPKSECKSYWFDRPQHAMCFDKRCDDLFGLIRATRSKIDSLVIKKDLIVIQNSKCFDAGLVAESQMRQRK